jgi:predicted HicB family RNase H-like nuclease
MAEILQYKGYIGEIKIDTEANVLYGEVVNTHDVITFQGTYVEEIRQAFIDSVEDYLEFCAERNEEPEKPFSGNLPLRMDPSIHKKAFIEAKKSGVSLNQWVISAIEKQLS